MNQSRKLKRELFETILFYLERGKRKEKDVVMDLKEMIEFFVSEGTEETVEAFCLAKLHVAKGKL